MWHFKVRAISHITGDLRCLDQRPNSIVSMSQGLPRGAGIGLALLLCVTGCTPGPTDSSGSAAQVPIHTLIFQDFELSWQTALPSAAVRDQISEALKPLGLSALLPTAVPSDWADPRGQLLVMRAAPSGAISIRVVGEFQRSAVGQRGRGRRRHLRRATCQRSGIWPGMGSY